MTRVPSIASRLLAAAIFFTPSFSQATCNGTFAAVTASDFVHSLNPGWNIGNTLDAVETEGDWGPALQYSTLENVQAAGYKGVRIPVTWAYHFDSESPTWDVNTVWMDRVEEVVDWTLGLGFKAIVNVHHDSWIWADLSVSDANYTMIEEKFYRLWYQIGTRLGCKSSALAFEPLNEPSGSTADQAAELNKLNAIFLQAITDAGGFNSERVVTLVGLGEDSVKTSQWFEAPANITNPWAIQYHYYSPYDFIFTAWGKTIWGSDADKATLENDLALMRGNFTDVPLLIGEWSAAPEYTETASRWKYFDFLVRTAASYDTVTMLWDWSYYYAASSEWVDPTAAHILINAAAGITNSLVDATEDDTLLTQTSSAYVWHKVGEPVTDETISLLLNGNTLTSISSTTDKDTLTEGTDYTLSSNELTFTSTFLSTIFTSPNTTSIGPLSNLTLHFSAGAPLIISAVQWSPPSLLNPSTTVPAATIASSSSGSYAFPINYSGLPLLATARALKSDGTILEDDWTQWLGPLQSGRLTRSSHFSWDAANLYLTSTLGADVVASNQDVTVMFEFFPRIVGENTVNVTLTV